jgi:hypothetical protein
MRAMSNEPAVWMLEAPSSFFYHRAAHTPAAVESIQ